MAGYNPDAAASLWRKMQEHSGDGGFEFLSTHPSHESRIENLETLAAKLKAGK
jgi:predicted Zn-dependent protease